MQVRVSELFRGLQGEGKYVGTPSVFLRLWGCNLTCAGFGMPKGQLSTEADEVARYVDRYEHYDDLPLVATGCDSYPSWHPAFKHLSPLIEVDDLAYKIVNILPDNTWGRNHLVITGGEPLLWQSRLMDLINHRNIRDCRCITFETNGTQRFSNEFERFLYTHGSCFGFDKILFSISPKLSCSGNDIKDTVKYDVIKQYWSLFESYLKFVVATDDDVQEVLQIVDKLNIPEMDVYLMPVGGTTEGFYKTDKQVAELAMKYGFKYSDRLHIRLYGNSWGA